jgi:hypothetical protein
MHGETITVLDNDDDDIGGSLPWPDFMAALIAAYERIPEEQRSSIRVYVGPGCAGLHVECDIDGSA